MAANRAHIHVHMEPAVVLQQEELDVATLHSELALVHIVPTMWMVCCVNRETFCSSTSCELVCLLSLTQPGVATTRRVVTAARYPV